LEADAGIAVTAPAKAARADEHHDVGESAEADVTAAGTPAPVDEAGHGDETGPGDETHADGFGSRREADASGGDDTAKIAAADQPPEAIPAANAGALPATERGAAAKPVALAAGGEAGSGSWISGIVGGTRPASWKIITTAAATAAVIAIALIIVAVSPSSPSSAAAGHKAGHKTKAGPVHVVSVSPGNGVTGVNGASPVTVTYSGSVAKHTPLPTLSPSIAGSWQVSGDTATFTPQVGYTEDTQVTVNIPAPAGTATTAATNISFTTGQYSGLRLDQLLSQLGYIPLTWAPISTTGYIAATDASAQLAAAYDPPAGTFSFDSGYPAALTSQWSAGTDNEIINGAVRTFEFDQGLKIDGDAGPQVWSDLLTAIAKGQQNQHGYTYVYVNQAGTETLDLYHNGQLAITSPVNTGIAASPTVDGTFPVYLRYQVTQMQGFNPDGSHYDDTVYWVSYFNGGDAVHAFPRGSYGWYQSLGCVELPMGGSTAEDVWNLITYGTLVTVTGPVA
jgi:hypothetical protein